MIFESTKLRSVVQFKTKFRPIGDNSLQLSANPFVKFKQNLGIND